MCRRVGLPLRNPPAAGQAWRAWARAAAALPADVVAAVRHLPVEEVDSAAVVEAAADGAVVVAADGAPTSH